MRWVRLRACLSEFYVTPKHPHDRVESQEQQAIRKL
jgi:hypothetical protein